MVLQSRSAVPAEVTPLRHHVARFKLELGAICLTLLVLGPALSTGTAISTVLVPVVLASERAISGICSA